MNTQSRIYKAIKALILLHGASLCYTASAGIVNVTYEAPLNIITTNFPSGLTVRGKYTFDDTLSSTTGTYPLISYSINIDGVELIANDPKIRVGNDICCVGGLFRDRYQVLNDDTDSTIGFINSLAIRHFGLNFESDGNPNDTLTSTALPSTLEELNGFTSRLAYLTVRDLSTGQYYAQHGVVTSLIFNSSTTPEGTNVQVTPPAQDENGNFLEDSPVSFNFSEVVSTGETTVQVVTAGEPVPLTFKLGQPPVYYNLETTASFSGDIEICIDYTDTQFVSEANARLIHFNGSGWVDITSSLDINNNIICGQTSFLSPFSIVESASPTEMVTGLMYEVMTLNLKHGIENALDAKLDAATNALADMKNHDSASAINMLYAFIKSVEAQKGKAISIEDAEDLVAKTNEIIQALTP